MQTQHATQHREMLIEIATGDDRALGMTREALGKVRLLAGSAAAQPFRMVMMQPDRFALRVPESHDYLAVDEDGSFSLTSAGEAQNATFQLVGYGDSRTHFGFKSLATGAHVSAAHAAGADVRANAPALGDAEAFTFRPILPDTIEAPPDAHGACCCGPSFGHAGHRHAAADAEAGAGALWDEYTHFRIVEMAVHYLRHMHNPTPEATFVSTMWHDGVGHVAEGLKGADDWDDWRPTHPVWFMYHYHFYNPDTQSSFAWPQFLYPHHAVSKGTDTFDASVRLYREHRRKDALVHLGLSLHYLTDLCQPMHAANFTNDPLNGDWRHSGYEHYADEFVKHRNFFRQPGGYPPIVREEVADTGVWPKDFLADVAKQSLATWKEVLRAEAEKKIKTRITPWGPLPYYENVWRAEEADASLMRSLWLAPRNAARYLCIWANRVNG